MQKPALALVAGRDLDISIPPLPPRPDPLLVATVMDAIAAEQLQLIAALPLFALAPR